MLPRLILAAFLSLLMLTAAAAGTTPAQQCAAAKVAAAGKKADAKLICAKNFIRTADAAKRATCLMKADQAFAAAFQKAEAKPGCVTKGDATTLEADVDAFTTLVVNAEPASSPVCGTFLTSWGSFGTGDGQFSLPNGIAVDGSGNVFVLDDVQVQKFTNNGTFLTRWGSLGTGAGQLDSAQGIAVDGSGNVFVTERFADRVSKFDNTGTFLLTFGWGVKDGAMAFEICTSGCQGGYGGGGTPNGDGELNLPLGIAVDGSGNVFVVDNGNSRIQEFENSGGFLAKWDMMESGNGAFGAAVDGSGNVFVTDNINNLILKFTNSGTFLTEWGSAGTGDGRFMNPEGVAVDGSGNVFVADTLNQRIQKFTNTGTFLTTWGTPGGGDGQFTFPDGIAVDGRGNVFVADNGNHRVQKFACP
jgi:tripartite motif-containing protein 71